MTKEETVDKQELINTKLDLARSLAKVRSDIHKEITKDFVYARLNEKDQEMITELTQNAYFGIRVMKSVAIKARKWKWNNENEEWIRETLNQEEKTTINKTARQLFSTFMIRPYMTSILKRNVKDNWMVRWSLDVPEENKDENEGSDEGLINKIKTRLQNETEE